MKILFFILFLIPTFCFAKTTIDANTTIQEQLNPQGVSYSPKRYTIITYETVKDKTGADVQVIKETQNDMTLADLQTEKTNIDTEITKLQVESDKKALEIAEVNQ